MMNIQYSITALVLASICLACSESPNIVGPNQEDEFALEAESAVLASKRGRSADNVRVCHKGQIIMINENALAGHFGHGDLPLPIALWDGDNVEGETVIDLFGGHDGDLVGAGVAPGRNDGAGNYIALEAPVIDNRMTFSIGSWINGNAYAGTQRPIYGEFANVNALDTRNYLAVNPAGNGEVFFDQFRRSGGFLRSVTAPVPGEWTHVMYVQDATLGTRSMYVNGVLESTDQNIEVYEGDPPTSFWIGRRLGVAQFFSGLIDELEIYDMALSGGQINALVNENARCTLATD